MARYARFVHEPTLHCDVFGCQSYGEPGELPEGGLFKIGKAIPAPYPNPTKAGGTDWYHGTSFDPHNDDEDDEYKEHGGTVRGPMETSPSGYEHGERAEEFWNTDLGSHFTSLRSVAHQFADKGASEHGRVLTAGLHMGNPKHYADEHEMANHAVDWARKNGHKFLQGATEEQHRRFSRGEYGDNAREEDEDSPIGSHLGYLHNHMGTPEEVISQIDRKGGKGVDQGHKEAWLGLHPNREEVTDGFKEHLKSQGHDGIVYGNDYEGPAGHTCAIAFDTTPIHHRKWTWTNAKADAEHHGPRPKFDDIPGQSQMKIRPDDEHGGYQLTAAVQVRDGERMNQIGASEHPQVDHYQSGGIGHREGDESRSVVGFMPTSLVRRYREHGGDWNPDSRAKVDAIKEDLRSGRGITSPLTIDYDHKEGWGYLGEGNHRLQAAHEAGLQTVPVRIYGRSHNGAQKRSEGIGARMAPVEPFVDDPSYSPPDIHPHLMKWDDGDTTKTARFYEGPWPEHIHGDREEWMRRTNEDHQAHLHAQRLDAEKATNGNMVNAAGRARGITGEDFFKPGNRRSIDQWGSDEMKRWNGSENTAQIGDTSSLGHVFGLSEYRRHVMNQEKDAYQRHQDEHGYSDEHDDAPARSFDYSHIFASRTAAGPHIDMPSVEDDPARWGPYGARTADFERNRSRFDHSQGIGGGITLYHAPPEDGIGDVYAHDGQGVVGHAFYGDHGTLPGRLEGGPRVAPTHRERGIGSAMYHYIEDRTGKTLAPSERNSDLAKALWSGDRRDFGRTAVLDEWRPTRRLFAPTLGSVDPRLFDRQTQQMHVEIREHIMLEADSFFEDYGYRGYDRWSRVYLAGSSVSGWWAAYDYTHVEGVHQPGAPGAGDAPGEHAAGEHLRGQERGEDALRQRTSAVGGEPVRHASGWTDMSNVSQSGFTPTPPAKEYGLNDDLDILIGIRYDEFRKDNPQFADETVEEIDSRFNIQLRESFQDDEIFFVVGADEVPEWEWASRPEDGSVLVGPWGVTGYVNPNSWDIAEIKPYAAYNVTDDKWAVKPIEAPEGHQFNQTEIYYFEGVAAQARQALGMDEPLRTRRCTQIWEFVHSSRSQAFGPHGSGAFDYRNALEKYLDQAPSPYPGVSLMQALANVKYGKPQKTAARDLPPLHHGTRADLGVGETLLPGSQTRHSISDRVWLTTDPEEAHRYAVQAAGEGEPRVYEVRADQATPRAVPGRYVAPSAQVLRRHGMGMAPHDEQSMAFPWDEQGTHDKKRVYLRFGDWDPKERSNNWVTGHPEGGVSVYELNKHGNPIDPDSAMNRDEHLPDDDYDKRGNDTSDELRGRVHNAERAFHNGVWDAKNARAHLVTGDHVGFGHDDEPLLTNVKRVGDWIQHRHLFVPTAEKHRMALDPGSPDDQERKEYIEHDFGHDLHLPSKEQKTAAVDPSQPDEYISHQDLAKTPALTREAGMFGPSWFENAHDDEIDAHPAADSIRSSMTHHVSPQGHVYRLTHDSARYVHAVYLGKGGNRIKKPQSVGRLSWFGGKANDQNNIEGRIHKVFVKPAHRRRGLASAMLDHARAMSPNDDILHSSALSEDGRAWSEKKARRTAGANGDLPEGITFRHGGPGELPDHYPFSPAHEGEHEVRAFLDGKSIGQIRWGVADSPKRPNVTAGHIYSAGVHRDYQRRGVASAMLDKAREIEPRVHHSSDLTDQGRAWSEKKASANIRLEPTGADYNRHITEYDVQGHGISLPEEDGFKTQVRFEKSDHPDLNHRIIITQQHPPVIPGGRTFGKDVGRMSYHPETGRVEGIQTHDAFARKGVATGMWNLAKQLHEQHGTVAPAHSETQTPDGKAWASTVASLSYAAFLRHTAAEEYRDSHLAPGTDDTPLHEMPDDIVEHPEYYSGGSVHVSPASRYHCDVEHQHAKSNAAHARGSLRQVGKALGKPDEPVTIYRSVPHHVTSINTGDWVALHPGYAQSHAQSRLGKDYKILKATVPAKHVNWNWDSLDEFGYNGPHVHHAEEHTDREPELPYHNEDGSVHHPKTGAASTGETMSGRATIGGYEHAFIHFPGQGGEAWSYPPNQESPSRISEMVWDKDGTITSMGVHPEHRRKGVASAMWSHARGMGVPLRHSSERSDAGDAWARSIGGNLPERTSSPHSYFTDPATGHHYSALTYSNFLKQAGKSLDRPARRVTLSSGHPADDRPVHRKRDRDAIRAELASSPHMDADEADAQANTIDHWSGKLYHPRTVVVRHPEDDHPIGSATYEDGARQSNLPGSVDLRDLRIAPSQRGNGAGSAVIDHLKDVARTGRDHGRELHVYNMVKSARPFYAKNGFDVRENSGTARADLGEQTRQGAKQDRVSVAGAGILAANTGRLLLIQRSNKDLSDPARGLWELPGGHLDEGESPWEAAQREWEEETGVSFPAEGHLAGNWISNGIYQAHLFVVPSEESVDIHPDSDERVGNPDDPGGDDIEAVAWWEPSHLLKSNRTLRPEFIEGLDRGLLNSVVKEHCDVDEPKKTASLADALHGAAVVDWQFLPREAAKEPMTLSWLHNDTPSTQQHADPTAYGRDVEPAGRYLIDSGGAVPRQGWSAGESTFHSPLHLDFGGGYEHPSNWKRRLSQNYGGKTGHELSQAVRDDGYDAIVTHDKYGTSEIVDLTHHPKTAGRTPEYDDPELHQEPPQHGWNTVHGAHNLYGKNAWRPMFGDAPTAMAPWRGTNLGPGARERAKKIAKVVANPGPHVQALDPRELQSTQPSVSRAGVAYYLHSTEYRDHGHTFADQDQPGNQTPVVWKKKNGQHVILSGHHRAAADLLRGRPFRAAVVHEQEE